MGMHSEKPKELEEKDMFEFLTNLPQWFSSTFNTSSPTPT